MMDFAPPLRNKQRLTPAEHPAFKPTIARFCFGHHVLVVARTRIEGTWKAYIDAVDGVNHEFEQEEVLRTGRMVPEAMARTLFPEFEGMPYAR